MDAPNANSKLCRRCQNMQTKEKYSKKQWKSKRGSFCKTCIFAKIAAADVGTRPENSKMQRADDQSQLADKKRRRTEDQSQHAKKRKLSNAGGLSDSKKKGGELVDKRRFSFNWPARPVPERDEHRMASVLVRRGEFGPLDDGRNKEIERVAKTLQISADQAFSLRSALLQEKARNSHYRLGLKGKDMLRLYNEGTSVVDLSKRFDLPPMNVFRTILAQMKWTKAQIKKCFKCKKHFDNRERKEFEAAEAADIVSRFDQSQSQQRADTFENALADWFESRGVRICRQAEMVKEQRKRHGQAIRTPDVLFLDHVEINGAVIAWMDAKNFFGTDAGFQRSSTEKQTKKYFEKWGNGAIVYRYGFAEKLSIPWCIMLDANALDLPN
mmetsp:Transcript_2293/g.6050  ORF Transcript_2293/g.6050 Transcript_2293/m.6050 type:complete len:383 (-) Transcript_2293:346-1494(-)